MADRISTLTAQNTLKEISKESISLEASSIISFYEIDLTSVKLSLNIGSADLLPDILRFHNEEVFNRTKLYFRGDTYHPMPILADGFEMTMNGSLPRPTLTITSMMGILAEAESHAYFNSLKRAILELENMIGAKVSRIRTFYKFLDASNNLPGVGDFSSGVNNNPEFPKETYFVERKVSEDKNGIQLELSSVLDLERFKLPGRLCLANRCPWTYRGAGCCYEFNSAGVVDEHGATGHMPDFAPPIANDEDELIEDIVTGNGAYLATEVTAASVSDYMVNLDLTYSKGDVVYIAKNSVRYYYVAKVAVPAGFPPPHSEYWEADQCSKSLKGCKLRWGGAGAAKNCTNEASPCAKSAANKFLPFGGFPGTNTKTTSQ
jgi:lambda family phage minor tail protein L